MGPVNFLHQILQTISFSSKIFAKFYIIFLNFNNISYPKVKLAIVPDPTGGRVKKFNTQIT